MAQYTKEEAQEKIKVWRRELREHQQDSCDCDNHGRCVFRQQTLIFEIKKMVNRFRNS